MKPLEADKSATDEAEPVLTEAEVKDVRLTFEYYGDARPDDALRVCDSHEKLRAVLRTVMDSEVNVVLLLAGKPVYRKLGDLLGERNPDLYKKVLSVLPVE